MARYYRRRYTRVVAPKKKWCSNLKSLVGVAVEYQNPSEFSVIKDLVINNSDGATPTPVVVKTGNFKAQIDMTINVGATGTIEAAIFIMFVPQGMTLTNYTNINNYITCHPEWILAWRQLDFGNANAQGSVDTTVVRFGSRLKKNLNSGDRICLFVLGSGNFTGVQTNGVLNGRIQYWTCAN